MTGRVGLTTIMIVGVVLSAAAGQEQQAAIAKSGTASEGGAASPKRLRVVFFGAHCDDNELGAGGLMRMLADQGHEVISAYATAFRQGRQIQGQPEDTVRRGESTAACKILGATPHFFPFAHEELEKPFADKATLQRIVAWLREIQPDIVVAHWPLDTHPNHQVVGMAAWMAYQHRSQPTGDTGEKNWNLYYYEVNTFTPFDQLQTLGYVPNGYLDVGAVRETKRRAIDCLVSQDPKLLWSVHDNMHQKRGAECGVPYAEAYFLVEAKPGCPRLPVTLLQKRN